MLHLWPTDAQGPLTVQPHLSTPVTEMPAVPVPGLGLGAQKGKSGPCSGGDEGLSVLSSVPLCVCLFLFLCSSPSLPTSTPRQTQFHSLTPTFTFSRRHKCWRRHAASVKTRSEPNMTCDRKERNSCIRDSFPVTPTGSETFNTIFSQAPGVSKQPGLRGQCEPSAPSFTNG